VRRQFSQAWIVDIAPIGTRRVSQAGLIIGHGRQRVFCLAQVWGVSFISEPPTRWTRRVSLFALCAPLLWISGGCKQGPRHASLPEGAEVLALGDSITFGIGAAAGEDWPHLLAGLTGRHIVNAGVPGDTAQNARSRLGAILSDHRPGLRWC
jgi:hypothetical protein